jgi:hypothetical protein
MTLTGMYKCTSAGRVDIKWLSVVVKKQEHKADIYIIAQAAFLV